MRGGQHININTMRAYARSFWPSELHVHEYSRACVRMLHVHEYSYTRVCAHVQGGALLEGYVH